MAILITADFGALLWCYEPTNRWTWVGMSEASWDASKSNSSTFPPPGRSCSDNWRGASREGLVRKKKKKFCSWHAGGVFVCVCVLSTLEWLKCTTSIPQGWVTAWASPDDTVVTLPPAGLFGFPLHMFSWQTAGRKHLAKRSHIKVIRRESWIDLFVPKSCQSSQ